jgi:hypothetical protein
LQTQYAFKDIGEVNEAMSYAVPLAKSAGVGFRDMAAALALLSASGKHGAEAGTAFAELVQKLSTAPKARGLVAHTVQGGIDLGRTLDRLRAATAGLDPIHEAMYLHQLGFTERSIVGVSLLIDKTAMYHSAVNDLSNAQGANAAAYVTRLASQEIATARLSAAWDVFKAKIGDNLLGPVTAITNRLTGAVAYMTAFADANPKIVKFIVTFTAIAAAIAIVAGGALALVGGFMAFASFAPAVAAIIGGWAATIALWGMAVALVGASWIAFKSYFIAAENSVHMALVHMGDAINSYAAWMYQGGANLVKALASGIGSALMYPVHAIGGVLSAVRAHLPFSPAKVGPLRDLNRVRIVETIAQSITPGPAILAMRRTAAAVAIAAPMVLSPMMSAPVMAGSSAGGASGGSQIVIHYSPTINMPPGSNEKDLMAILRHHSEEIAQMVGSARVTKHGPRHEF